MCGKINHQFLCITLVIFETFVNKDMFSGILKLFIRRLIFVTGIIHVVAEWFFCPEHASAHDRPQRVDVRANAAVIRSSRA
jgi:hypothetical protein